jgi:hypothetical protein
MLKFKDFLTKMIMTKKIKSGQHGFQEIIDFISQNPFLIR